MATRSHFNHIVATVLAIFASVSLVSTNLVLALNAPIMVKDINPGSGNSSPSQLIIYAGKMYFNATDATHGQDFWQSDGTAGGTALLKDINPGSGGSAASSFAIYNNLLYFNAIDGTNGAELWQTDGTLGGTVLFKDINSGAGGSSPTGLIVYNNLLYFGATDGSNGSELWQSDGTPGGTVMVADINPGAGSSSPVGLTIYNNLLYFRATDGTNGIELWQTDGTSVGTVMLKDINPGSVNSVPQNFVVYNNLLYFSATDGTNGIEPWQSDGTTIGTVMLKDINPGSGNSLSTGFTIYNNFLYFGATDGTNGTGLWQSDGTSGGTVMVKEINPAVGSVPSSFVLYNNLLYFNPTDGVHGSELWQSDGTSSGTVMVADINPGSGSSTPGSLIVYNNLLYFAASDGVTGREFWSYNSIIGSGVLSTATQLTISTAVNGGSLSVNDIDIQMNGEIVSPGIYTRTSGTYLISASPVTDYALSFQDDCSPSGSVILAGSPKTCTVTYTYLIIPSPTPEPSPSVSVSPSLTPSIPPTPSVSVSPSPSLTPTPSPTHTPTPFPTPSVSASPSPTPSILPLPSVSISPLSPSELPSGPSEEGEDTQSFIQSVSESLGNIAEAVTTTVKEDIIPTAAPVLSALVSVPVLVSGLSAAASSGSPLAFSLSELRHLLEIVGLKKKRRVWGVIYDSKTKKPIPYAKVDLKDQSNRILETRFADRFGRYGFLTSSSSLHQKALSFSLSPISPKYAFPSQIVTSDPDFIVYDHIYKGGLLTTNKGTLINYNIPLDSKDKQISLSPISTPLLSRATTTLLNAGFWVGILAAPLNAYLNPSAYSISILSVFILANLYRISSDMFRPFGLILDSKTQKPLPYALVTLNDSKGTRLSFSVSDDLGRYFLLTDPGSYTLAVHTPAHIQPPRSESLPLTSKKGWVREKISI